VRHTRAVLHSPVCSGPTNYSDERIANRNVRDFEWEMSSRGRFVTPADFPLHDFTAYRGLHNGRESLGFVRGSRIISCHPYGTIRNCVSSLWPHSSHREARCYTTAARLWDLSLVQGSFPVTLMVRFATVFHHCGHTRRTARRVAGRRSRAHARLQQNSPGIDFSLFSNPNIQWGSVEYKDMGTVLPPPGHQTTAPRSQTI
jgi:hypothetical protein